MNNRFLKLEIGIIILQNKSNKPRVLLIANAAFNILNFRAELINAFQTRGYSVEVICPPKCNLTNKDNINEIFNDMDVQFWPVDFNRTGVNPVKELISFLNLLHLIRKRRPDIILNYTVKPVIYGSIAAKICNIRRIGSNITGLGYAFTSNDIRARIVRLFLRILYKISLQFNSVVYFQNTDDLNLFNRLKLIDPSVVTKVLKGSGVNLSVYCPSSDEKKYPLSFLFVGRLIKDKGIYEFIDAAKMIKQRIPLAKFTIVGPLDVNPSAISMEAIRGLSDNGIVQYVGPSKNVLQYLRQSDVFVLPSYREGTPKSALEAMAVGLPIITTDVPGCRETVVNGGNGFLVPARDVEGLYAAMMMLIESPDLRTRMGLESRRMAHEYFDVNKVNSDILKTIVD